MLDKLFNDYIGRVVVCLTAILLPVSAVIANWVRDTFDFPLSANGTAAFLVAVVLGVGAVGYKWLHNRGAYERLLLEFEKLYESGAVIRDREQSDQGTSGP